MGSLRGSFNTEVERLKPAGRTVMLPAIIEAKRQLERQDAGRKHVIILSDGETGGSGGDFQRAGHREDLDRMTFGFQRGFRTRNQLVVEMVVETRFDDQWKPKY